MESFGTFLLDGFILLALFGGMCRYLLGRLDTNGEVQDAAKQKVKSKILDWFKKI